MMLKETSLASTFFLGDIMTSYNVVKGATFLTLEPLTIVAVIYLCLTFPLSKIVEKFEKKMAKPNSYRNHKRKNKIGGKI
jgi:ABC-type amino acid transport system permease subunit